MAETLPDPLVPADVDLRGLEWMPLYGNRLFGSDFDAHADDTSFRCGLQLWWAAWNQVPAASLPDDDVALCRLAGLGRDAKTWRRVKTSALRGFLMCSDGRLYHRTLSQWAVQAWDRRRRDRDRKAKWRASQEQTRPADKDRPVTPSVPVSGTAERRGDERRGDESKKEDASLSHSAPAIDAEPLGNPAHADDDLEIPKFLKRASHAQVIGPDWLPSAAAQADLVKSRPDLTPERIIERTEEFRLWCAETNKTSHNPDATWLGFMRRTHEQRSRNPSRVQPSSASPETDGISAAFARRSVLAGG